MGCNSCHARYEIGTDAAASLSARTYGQVRGKSWQLMITHQSESDDLETQRNTCLAELTPICNPSSLVRSTDVDCWRCSVHRVPLQTGSSGLGSINIFTKTKTNAREACIHFMDLCEEHLCSRDSHSSLHKLMQKNVQCKAQHLGDPGLPFPDLTYKTALPSQATCWHL